MPKATSGGGPPPPAPPPPPNAPPPPPADGNLKYTKFQPAHVCMYFFTKCMLTSLNITGLVPKQMKIEKLKKAPKRRPDWAGMMKEIERGRNLNHVDCNDRSKPMLTKLKSRGKVNF